ncbi:MAG: prepilin-type N-terminal cleavage/methylation domain-containing protein [Actinomycetota bacterium]
MEQRQLKRTRRGFTLVEILIVILIIGILLAVAAPMFVRARENSQAKSCQHNLKQILGAKERWAMDNNRGGSDTPTMAELAGATRYIKVAPVCQGGGTYTVGQLDKLPTCSIGGAVGDLTAHAIE